MILEIDNRYKVQPTEANKSDRREALRRRVGALPTGEQMAAQTDQLKTTHAEISRLAKELRKK